MEPDQNIRRTFPQAIQIFEIRYYAILPKIRQSTLVTQFQHDQPSGKAVALKL